MEQNDLVIRAWERASFHHGWEAEEIQKVRANVRALLGPKSECVVSSTVESGDVLSPDKRGYRTVSWTNRTLIVHGRPARSNSWFNSHDKIPGGEISLQDSDLALGTAVDAVCEQVLLRLRKRLEEILTFGMPRPLERGWAELVAAQLATWEAEDAALIAAAHAIWNEEDRLAVEADDLKTRAHNLSKLPAGNELGDAPALFDSWHRPVEELRDLVAGLRTWFSEAEARRKALIETRHEAEIAVGLAKEERLVAIAAAMAAPATPAPWFVGCGIEIPTLERLTGRKHGEGCGDKLAGKRETRCLPGNRPLVALRITSGGRRKHYNRCEVSHQGLAPVSDVYQVAGRDSEDLIATALNNSWHVIEKNYESEVLASCDVTTRDGTATFYPSSQTIQSRPWGGAFGADGGPTEDEVRKILGLAPRASGVVEEPVPVVQTPTAPPPAPKPAVEAKPAAPAAVAATLASLQGKFKKR